jgi:hypothetical protein
MTRCLSLALAAAAATMAGCSAVLGMPRHSREVDLSVTHVERAPVRVDAVNGAIAIMRADVEMVEVHAVIRGPDLARVEAANVHAERIDDELRIRCEWPTPRKSNEGCSFEVRVPDAHGVYARTMNGSIRIESLEGPVVARSSNGAIVILGRHGEVRAETSNGSIRVERASGPVVAGTSNGSITVALSDDNAGPVRADTSNGSITLEIGRAFTGPLTADTSLGRVSLGPFPDAWTVEVLRQGKTHAVAEFGSGGSPSELDTSNGSVTIRAGGGS